MSEDGAIVEAEVVEPGTELEQVSEAASPPSNLFHTNNPAEVLTRAQETAEALMPVIRKQGLVSNIQGREYLNVEAWLTLATMVSITPVCTWTRKLEDGWEARVEARTLDGRVIGAAEAECLRSEKMWKGRDDFAIRSMAQTRATSKALASVLRFIATLAGFQGTPAEEMPREDGGGAKQGEATANQKRFLTRLMNQGGLSREAQRAIVTFVCGEPRLTFQAAGPLIEQFKDDPKGAADAFLDQMREAAEGGNEKAREALTSIPSDVPYEAD